MWGGRVQAPDESACVAEHVRTGIRPSAESFGRSDPTGFRGRRRRTRGPPGSARANPEFFFFVELFFFFSSSYFFLFFRPPPPGDSPADRHRIVTISGRRRIFSDRVRVRSKVNDGRYNNNRVPARDKCRARVIRRPAMKIFLRKQTS